MVPKILSYFCDMKDPRIERRKLHPLETLLLEGCTVSIGAMGCQKEIAQKIWSGNADYILAVKANLYHNSDRNAVSGLLACASWCGVANWAS